MNFIANNFKSKMKLIDYFKIGKHRQSKMPLTIAIGIPSGVLIGIIAFIILNKDLDMGMTLGGVFGLSIGFLIGAIIDVHEKRKK